MAQAHNGFKVGDRVRGRFDPHHVGTIISLSATDSIAGLLRMDDGNETQIVCERYDQVFFTVEVDGDIWDSEYTSKAKAVEGVDEWFAGQYDDEPMRNGETREGDSTIIEFVYDEETGERIEISRTEHSLEYEYYHGDLAEHGTYW